MKGFCGRKKTLDDAGIRMRPVADDHRPDRRMRAHRRVSPHVWTHQLWLDVWLRSSLKSRSSDCSSTQLQRDGRQRRCVSPLMLARSSSSGFKKAHQSSLARVQRRDSYCMHHLLYT